MAQKIIILALSYLIGTLALANTSINDEMGVFTIDSVPDRVVVLEFSFVDALANIGVSPIGVADDDNANNLIEAIRSRVNPWTSVGSRYQPSLEVIASLKPDLIIADPDRNASIYEDLKKIAPTVVLKSRGETYQDNLDTFVKIGTLMGQESAVKERLNEHQKRMDTFAAQISSELRFQFAVANERGLWMHGPKSYAGSVMERLGLQVATADERETAYFATTLEQLLNTNPDVFLLGEYGETTIVDAWKTNPLWSRLSATTNDRFYLADPRLWSLNRGMIAAELMAAELVELINQS